MATKSAIKRDTRLLPEPQRLRGPSCPRGRRGSPCRARVSSGRRAHAKASGGGGPSRLAPLPGRGPGPAPVASYTRRPSRLHMRWLLRRRLLGKRPISAPRAGRRPHRQGPPVPPRTLVGAVKCTARAPACGAAPAGGARPSWWAGPRPRVRAVRLGRRRHDEQRRDRGPVGLPPGPHVRHPGHQPLLGRD